MSHSQISEKKVSVGDLVTGVIIIALLTYAIYWAINNSETFFNIAQNTFQLTKQELTLIPFGIVLFLAFWWEMKYLLFTPFMQLLEDREAASSGALDKAKKFNMESDRLSLEINKAIADAKLEAMSEKIQELAKAKEQAGTIIKQAQKEADQKLGIAREQNLQTTSSLKQQLLSTGSNLVDSIVDSIQMHE